MKKMTTILVVLVMIFAAPAFAATLTSHVDSEHYIEKAPSMLFRGVGNMLLAPVELVYHTADEAIHGKPVLGLFEGMFVGLKQGLDHGFRGLLDVGGALVPGYHGAPPEHRAEILDV